MKSSTFKILEAVLHVLGFPVMMVVVVLLNLNVFQSGAQYGVFAFASLILVGVAAVIYYLAYFLLAHSETKKRAKIAERIESAKASGLPFSTPADPARRTGIILAIIVVCMMSGLWILVDTALPGPIATATSSTLYWEDLADNWNERADVNEELLTTFITRAYNAGNLQNKTLDEYLKEGIRNKEVKELINQEFQSIDQNGFASFTGPSVDFALTDRMTIPALIHLLLDNREHKDLSIPIAAYTATQLGGTQSAYTGDKPMTVGANYTYLHSGKQYIAFTGTYDTVGVAMDSLILLESTPTYVKAEYLAGNVTNSSFVFELDSTSGKVQFNYYLIKNGKTILERKLKQLSANEVEISVSDSRTEIENTYVLSGEKLLTKADKGYAFDLTGSLSMQRTESDSSVTNKDNTTLDGLKSVDKDLYDAIIEMSTFMALEKADLSNTANFKPKGWSFDKKEDKTDSSCIFEKTTVQFAATWNVLDMLGEPMGFNLPIDTIRNFSISITTPITLNLSGEQLIDEYGYVLNDVFYTLSVLASNDNIIGSELTITLDTETGELLLTPSNVQRGTLDYMKIAWLQNNGLVYVIVSFFSLRKITYIYAPILALLSYLIGFMREMSHGTPKAKKKSKETAEEPVNEEAVAETDL